MITQRSFLCIACLTPVLVAARATPPRVDVLQPSSLRPPPLARVEPVTDVYYGTKVLDPYRYMENLSDPEVQSWMKTQNDYTRASNRLRLSIGTLGNGTSGN